MDGEPQTLVDNTYSSKSCHDASKGDAEQTGSLQYTEAVKESRTYSKTQGFSVSGDTSGLTGACFEAFTALRVSKCSLHFYVVQRAVQSSSVPSFLRS